MSSRCALMDSMPDSYNVGPEQFDGQGVPVGTRAGEGHDQFVVAREERERLGGERRGLRLAHGVAEQMVGVQVVVALADP